MGELKLLRNKEFLVRAIQWDGKEETYQALTNLGVLFNSGDVDARTKTVKNVTLHSARGSLAVNFGDWVVLGHTGWFNVHTEEEINDRYDVVDPLDDAPEAPAEVSAEAEIDKAFDKDPEI